MMRFFLLLLLLTSSNLFAGFEHCRLRAIDGDPPFYINVCSTPHGEMRVDDYFRYLDEGLRANIEFKVIDERDFLPEEDYPSRPSEIDPAQLSETLRSIAKLGRVSDSEEMLRSREREENVHSINERVRQINRARDWLERERSSANDLQGIQSLRAQLKDPNPIIRVGAVSLMEAQRSQKKFSGEFGKGHRALKEKFKAVRAEDIKSYKLVGSSAQTFLRSEKEFETGDKNFASELLSLSESLLDVGLGLAPGSSLVKDTYELIFGTNMVTGAELSPLDRGISLVGVGVGIASFGTAGGVATSLLRSQKLVKLADHFSAVSFKFLKTPKSVFDQALGVGEKVVEAAGKLGVRTKDEISELIDITKAAEGKFDDLYGYVNGKLTRFGPLNDGGPLRQIELRDGGGVVADTFRSSSYFQNTLEGPVKLYRVYGGEAGKIAAYWSRTKPTGPMQVTLDLALDPNWRNSATKWVEITVPPHTKIFEGMASSMPLRGGTSVKVGELLGGGSQVYLKEVNPSWVTNTGGF
jgi:hypothetical protein